MKHMKKLASLLLALVMVFGLATTAFAASVTNNTKHSYDVYQIFSGTQADNSIPLGDVNWGTGINGAAFLAELKTDARFQKDGANIFESCKTAMDVAEVLGNGYTDNSDVAKAFANVAAKHLGTETTSIAADAKDVNLPAGYYLLVDTTDVGEGDARNSALLQVTNKGDITIEGKYTVPSVDKSVLDSDGTAGETADWEIGSAVPFVLTGTLPTNYADYETYKYVFHDTLSAGLEYKGGAKVYVVNNGTKTEITEGYAVAEHDNELTFTFANLKNVTSVNASSKIVVEYSAVLTADAVIGGEGNKNTVYVEYSNDPNADGDGTTGNTPSDETLVFTYELDVTKVDGDHPETKLKAAEFVLLNSDKSKAAKVVNGKFAGWGELPTTADDNSIVYAEGTKLTTDDNGLFKIPGLDAGTYFLRETKAPFGYNQLKEDIKIVIAATLDKTENTPKLTALTITVGNGDAENGDLANGVVSTTVENKSGAQLPETGGMGTTLFYVLGGILVLTAVVLLVTRKRMSGAEN